MSLGHMFINLLVLFLRVHFFPLEKYFTSYLRHNIRHFDKYTNSVHEGSNNGLKNSGIGCKPYMTMDVAAAVMNTNAEMSVHTQLQTAEAELNSKPTWSQSKVGTHIIANTYGLFQQQWVGRKLYECCKINGYQWKVVERNRCMEEKSYNSIKPDWKIGRLVTYISGIMKCSCCLFERHGYMCSCIACVIDSLPDYPGPTHHDFSVCHWKAYMHYGMLSVTTDDKKLTSMGQAIEAAMHNDVKGPSVPSECVTRTPRPFTVPKRFNTKITKVEAYNYTVVESDFLEFTPFDKTTFIFNGTKQDFEK